MQSGNTDTLPSDYYFANFHSLAGFVQDNYRDMLTDDENRWYSHLCDCTIAAQQLYIRLLTRKGSVFRLSKLHYDEIPGLSEARLVLAETSLSDNEPPTSLQTLLSAYTKPEISRLLALKAQSGLSRLDLVNSILDAQPDLQTAYLQKLQQADQWVTIGGHQHWTVYTLCFFGNLYQSSTDFVLRDLGSVSYEDYQINPDTRAFSSRSQVDAHLRYFECEALFDTIDIRQEDQLLWLVQQLPEQVPGDLNLKRRLDRLRNRVARQLERLGSTVSALDLFIVSSHPPARERQVRIHMKRGDLDVASVLVDAMLCEPFNEAEKSVANGLLLKLNKARGLKVQPQTRFRPDTTTLVLQPSTSRVELAARAFYARQGSCFYTENSLVSGVLGLFIWDIIFHPVKGVFFNPFQSAPADFYEPDFTAQRADLLDARFSELNDAVQFSTRILQGYTKHRGKSNPWVRWGQISEDLLTLALQQVPASHWEAMFKRLLQDPRENAAGFPDLIFFRASGEYEFIEIKGPGDTLQKNQQRWMRYFADHQIPCRVVNIRWAAEVPTTPP